MDITVGSNNSLNIIIKYVKLLLVALRVATHKSTIMACSKRVQLFVFVVAARRETCQARRKSKSKPVIQARH